jgi:hypothetical protein
MKLNFIYTAFALALVLLVGCKNGPEYEDVVFITGTESQPTITFTVDGSSASMGLTVTSSAKLEGDAKVSLKVAPELLDAYNKQYNRSYEMLPSGSYQLDNPDVTLKNGQYVSTQAKLSILSTENFKDGVTYCIPITIAQAQGLNVLGASRTTYIVINRVTYSKAVNLAGDYYFSVPSFATSSDVSAMSAMTMECKVYVNSFQDGSPYISSIIGIEENFLLRFGDVSCDKNQLQVAAGTIGGKKYPMTTETHFSTGQWYHLAVVYNGSTSTIYINGKKETYATTSGGTINFNDTYMEGFHIGRSERGRYLDGYISEARVWNKALTPSQLQANVCYVDPTSEGLIAYWRFNGADQDDTTIKDLTGHGHDAISSSPIRWVENQKCPF